MCHSICQYFNENECPYRTMYHFANKPETHIMCGRPIGYIDKNSREKGDKSHDGKKMKI